MKKRYGKQAAVLVLSLFFLASGAFASRAASQIPLVLTGEDIGNGYQYEATGIGSFTVNGKDGQKLPAVIIDIQESTGAVLYRDGTEMEFQSGDLLIENGSYELYLYQKGQEGVGDYAIFQFQIQNEYETMMEETGKTEVVDDPTLVMSYEETTGMFRYTLPDGEYFCMDIPMGSSSHTAARLSFSEGLTAYTMRKDQEAMVLPENLTFMEPGHYEIVAVENQFSMSKEQVYHTGIWFTLKNDKPENINLVNAPFGFRFLSAKLNGREIPLDRESSMRLFEDGTYEFEFTDTAGEGLVWREYLTRDTTAPAIHFSVPVDGKVLKEDVSFILPGRRETMEIQQNGIVVTASENRIAQDGNYVITVQDEAGNSRVYEFSMEQGYQLFDAKGILLLAAILAILGGAMVYWRRTMYVR